ncbi:MAG TPA: D-glycero-beta-D-manno-heptose-7-phosphate kinase [Nitrospirota bacterium]|nr:D-glycero-beta-D-manno-heptose-7-phosphate kinase [Nitrospirota bacterium]
MDRKALLKYIGGFKDASILVVGDVMLDHFIWGKVTRISPEAPVPVVDINHESVMLGGAANVLNNIISLGGRAGLCGVVGHDEMGRRVVHELRLRNVNTDGLVVEEGRPTTVKTRVVAHSQQVVRFDRENKGEINADTERFILDCARKQDPLSGIIVSDYAKGVVTKRLVGGLVKIAGERGVPLAVDPKVGHFDFYKNVTVVTPNNLEASQAAGFDIVDDGTLAAAGKRLLEKLRCDAVLITRGEHGMSLFRKDGSPVHIPTVAKEVYDVTGAGDTVIAVFMLALASGAPMHEAAVIANHAAGIVVGEVGTATVSPERLRKAVKQA